jgi:hypothetical protein
MRQESPFITSSQGSQPIQIDKQLIKGSTQKYVIPEGQFNFSFLSRSFLLSTLKGGARYKRLPERSFYAQRMPTV